MIKICVFCTALCIIPLYAGERQNNEDYESFLAINTAYAPEQTVLVKQSIVKRKADAQSKISDTAYCLFHKNGQCVRIKTKTGVQYFFSSDQGYWLLTKKLKSPLKISGAYKVEEFEVQDMLKTDFKHEYRIAGSEGSVLTLERTTTKAAYKFVLFEKTDTDTFELTFTDTKKNPVRKLTYRRGTVDGYDCFREIGIYNLLFDKDSVSSWITERILPLDVPAALFTYSNMKMLAQKIEGMLQP